MRGLTRYGFKDAISGFFEFPTENARRILPPYLEPVELHHGSSVLSLTAFDFTDSEVGAYREVFMSVIVAPLLKTGERLPKSAFFPYQVATTTRAAREHAIDRWHLPHWIEDVAIDFQRQDGRLTARVQCDGATVAELSVADHSWQPVSHLYQAFIQEGDRSYLASVTMEGEYTEHEEETGRLRLFEHPFNRHLNLSEVSDIPFREAWMRNGVQTFENLVSFPAA